jgi:nucleoside-diphosphate-sugar epimerase
MVNYLFIDDFINGIDLLFNNNHSGIYNFCGSNSYPVKEYIVEKIIKLSNSKSSVTYSKKYPDNFVYNLDGDNNKLLKIGWKPNIDINNGLEKTVNFYKKLMI